MHNPKKDKAHYNFSVNEALWEQSRGEIQHIRNTVFVIEQHIPTELEWDGSDKDCIHVLAYDDQHKPIGTGRIQIHTHYDSGSSNTVRIGHIGRIAVLKPQRSHGVGSAVLTKLLDISEAQYLDSVYLNSQEHLQGFYELRGFTREGEVFKEAGIPHVHMIYKIT